METLKLRLKIKTRKQKCRSRFSMWLAVVICAAFLFSACGNRGQMSDGTYQVTVKLEGGSGKASIQSPATLTISDGMMSVQLVWSSKNYDYMLVDGSRYENENEGGNSTFTIPVSALDTPIPVVGDTTAMSMPHEVEYRITLTLTGQADGEDSGSGQTSEDSATDLTDSDQTGSGLTDTSQKSSEGAVSDQDMENCLFKLLGAEPVSLSYAKEFAIRREGSLSLLTIGDGDDCQYFLIADSPDDLMTGRKAEEAGTSGNKEKGTESKKGEGLSVDADSVILVYRPVENIYLAASSVMDLISQLGCTARVSLSGTKESDWYVEAAASAMEKGDMLYAGKYSAPDYELILSQGCGLAIENTMIYHTPEVKEKLEELGIPVLVERSSYETSPLGRLEWIKVYGELFGKEKEAASYFEKEAEKIEKIEDHEKTGKKIAFFSVNTNGAVVVRKPGDYIAKMIEMSGGEYALDGVLAEEDNALSTMNMQFEDFYAAACDADILIYNSTIEGEIDSISDLIEKNSLFESFMAVKSGQVYCCRKNFYQQTTGMAEFMQDVSDVCNGRKADLSYLKKLQ